MKKQIIDLLGKGPYPFPMDKMGNFTEYYESPELAIVVTKTDLLLMESQGIHVHDSFEFLIPFTPMPFIGCEGECHFVPCDAVFPINSNQTHGPAGDMKKCSFASIQASGSIIGTIAQQITGKKDFLFENESFNLSSELKGLIKNFIAEAKNANVGSRLMTENLACQIAVQLIRDYLERDSLDKRAKNSCKKLTIESMIHFVNGNGSNNEYSTRKAAKIANLSDYHFIRTFRNETGKTPYRYLLDNKINYARKLLKEKQIPITEICFLCGFTNHSHFATAFKKRVGMSPSIYRKMNTLG